MVLVINGFREELSHFYLRCNTCNAQKRQDFPDAVNGFQRRMKNYCDVVGKNKGELSSHCGEHDVHRALEGAGGVS